MTDSQSTNQLGSQTAEGLTASVARASQHSIGEWEYDESTGQVDVADGTICVGITWRPNGYLIEAAPDLLAALKAIRDETTTWGRYPKAAQIADAAIAKAEGRNA